MICKSLVLFSSFLFFFFYSCFQLDGRKFFRGVSLLGLKSEKYQYQRAPYRGNVYVYLILKNSSRFVLDVPSGSGLTDFSPTVISIYLAIVHPSIHSTEASASPGGAKTVWAESSGAHAESIARVVNKFSVDRRCRFLDTVLLANLTLLGAGS